VSAADLSMLNRNLKLGDQGPDVLLLQQFLNTDPDTQIATVGVGSKGLETDYFGLLTKAAVMKFQNKYRREVLYPAGLFAPTGYVGVMTRAKLSALTTASTVSPATTVVKTTKPAIFSVSPGRVRLGDTVTVTGTNFTPTGNTVILGDGPIDTRFENLSSPDGKTITFVYKPPDIKTMSEADIRALPQNFVAQIENPIKAAGGTLSEAIIPYKNIHSEAELRASLEQNQRSFDDMYHYFWILVENSYGKGMSQTALLYGLQKFPFDSVADASPPPTFFSLIGQKLNLLAHKVFPAASAQMMGGGITTGIIMVCTCSASLMTFQLDMSGAGTGLYVFSPGFIPSAGSGLIAGFWIGGYTIMAGQCSIYVGLACITIPGNTPMNPVGYSL